MKLLKAPPGGVDPNSVKICEACGLPAPLTTERCALCDKPFRAASPTSYQLVAAGRRYRWLVNGEESAAATFRDETWDIADAATGKVEVTIIPVIVDDVHRVAVVDHKSRTACTYTPVGAEESAAVGIVRDSHNEPMLVVRGDGPTGLHVTDVNGAVIAMAGTPEDAEVGLDILVTRTGAGHRRLLLGLTLAIELLRTGGLRPVS